MSVSANEIWRAIYDRVVGLIKAVGAGSGFPGGSYTEMQFNHSGSFDGTDGMAWNDATQQMEFTGDARFEKTISIPALSFFWAYLPDFEIGIGDGGLAAFTLPSDWDPSTDPVVKFRWFCKEAYATNSGEVNFQLDVAAAGVGEVFAYETPAPSGDINVLATQEAIAETSWTIDHTVLAAGDTLGLMITRIAIDDGNNPTAAIVAYISVDIEYTANRWGDAV